MQPYQGLLAFCLMSNSDRVHSQSHLVSLSADAKYLITQ